MKKIMFNDKYGLTEAVLQVRKTMTRRILTGVLPIIQELRISDNVCEYKDPYTMKWNKCSSRHQPKYQVGEVVAVAQSYKDAGLSPNDIIGHIDYGGNMYGFLLAGDVPGWNNKMFVKADLMPNLIRITDIKVERLQDISDEDVYKEGFECVSVNNGWGNYATHFEAMLVYYDQLGMTKTIQSRDPREAFSYLIDKVSGRGTWDSNPWVYAYTFELVK